MIWKTRSNFIENSVWSNPCKICAWILFQKKNDCWEVERFQIRPTSFCFYRSKLSFAFFLLGQLCELIVETNQKWLYHCENTIVYFRVFLMQVKMYFAYINVYTFTFDEKRFQALGVYFSPEFWAKLNKESLTPQKAGQKYASTLPTLSNEVAPPCVPIQRVFLNLRP